MKTKRFYQLTSYLLMAVCVTLFAGSLSSCNDESIADEVPVKSGKWQISIPATIDINADTRAVVYDESNKKLKAEFRTSDDIYVFKNGVVDSQALHPDNNGPTANLEGDLDCNYEVGDELILAYKTKNDGSVSFTNQEGGHVENGELDKFDYAMATVTVTSASNGNIKTTPAKFQSLQSMYKFTFVDEDNEPVKVTKVTVRTKNNDLITSADILGNTEKTKGEVTTDVALGVDAIPTGEVWMALSKASNSADTFYFSAIDNNNKSYMGSLDVASNVIQNGKFYTAIVKLIAVGFSVSANKQVAFALGNLQYIDGNWQFASHQYDYFGEAQDNNKRDLFSYSNGDDDDTTYSCPSPWRVLTQSEWDYVLNTRNVTNSLSSGARYTMATLGGGIKGMIIFPDNYSHPDDTGFSLGTFNAPSDYTATVNFTGWEKMEAAGAIFLPAAGYYTFNASSPTYKEIGSDGAYYSSSQKGNNYYAIYFSGSGYEGCIVQTDDSSWSSTRRSIRPVQDLN